MQGSLVIALTGLTGAGKSTAAKIILENLSFTKISFADPIRAMLKQLGLSEEELQQSKGQSNKLLCGRSPRFAMQTLGTEWGRDLIGENIWAEQWKRRTKEALAAGFNVVCDDCRFLNEVDAVRDLEGEIWNITRSGLRRGGHRSESGVAAMKADKFIHNSGTVEELKERILSALRR